MADFREKIKTIASTKGTSAPEPAKNLGMGCLAGAIVIVSILTFIITIGLFKSGSWIAGSFAGLFFLMSALTAAILVLPHKRNPL